DNRSSLHHQKTMIKWMMVSQRSGGATQGKAPMSGLEALPSWKYADVQPTAAQQPAQPWYRGRGCASAPARASSVKRPVSMAGVCTAAMLLLAVPLFTLEADARGGFGGHGGGFGGHGPRAAEASGAPAPSVWRVSAGRALGLAPSV